MSDTITLTGTVGSDPQHSISANNVERTTFRLASTQRRFDKASNEWVDVNTNWYGVTCFKRLAVNVNASLEKGQRVIITGRLEIRDYDKADGTKGTAVEIIAETIGHDLFWGTAKFHKHLTTAEQPQGHVTPVGDPWAASPTTAWGQDPAL